MPLIFSVNNDSLQVRFRGTVGDFSGVLQTLKSNKCTYDPDTKTWDVPPAKFGTIYDKLCDSERIEVGTEVAAFVRNAPSKASGIKKYRTFLDRDNLKVKPIVGKHPYEDFQYEDLLNLTSRNRFALFNEQGTGKSYELTTALDYYRQNGKVGKIIFLTSNSGVYNIKREIEKFTDFDMSRVAIAGVKNREPFKDDIDIVIMNYRSFLLVNDHYYYKAHPEKKLTKEEREDGEKAKLDYRKCPLPLAKWIGKKDAALVCDESHIIANPKARQSKVVMLASSFFEYRYEASGTPADKEEKYYTQLRVLDKSLVHDMSYQNWLDEYAVVGTRYSEWELDHFKPEMLPVLQKIVADNCVRRFADDVLDLPDNFYEPYYVEFSDLQREIYYTFVEDKLARIRGMEGGISTHTLKNSFQYLLLAIDNPTLLLTHEEKLNNPRLVKLIEEFNFQRDHSKLEALRDIIEKYPDSKIVVWNSHPSVADELALALKEYYPIVLNGETPIPKGMDGDEFKESVVKHFQESKKNRILIAGLQVLNTAVTIVESNVQIIYDCNFNFVEYSQALKRIHRIGQKRNVYTYAIVIDESIDVARKKNLDDKDYLNRNFLEERFLTQAQTTELFNLKGD